MNIILILNLIISAQSNFAAFIIRDVTYILHYFIIQLFY